jgi:hypothetical protein
VSDSKRQQIINAIDTRLKTILTTGGYNTNAGWHVDPWLPETSEIADSIALVYRDPDENNSAATEGSLGYHRHQLNIEIEIRVAAGSVTVATARKVLADIETAIGTDPKWSALAIGTYPGSNKIETAQNSNIVSRATMNFTITYQTKAWNPYT